MSSSLRFDRRKFLLGTTASLAVIGTSKKSNAAASMRARRDFEYGRPLTEFDYGDVTLTSGPCKTQLDQTHGILMGLDENSLLRPFRMAANLPAPGRDLSGWYSSPTLGPTTFGQWLSALSRYHAAYKDKAALEKVNRLIDGFEQTIEPTGKMFNLDPTHQYASYNYDLLAGGLVDAYRFAGRRDALTLLEMLTRVAIPHLPGRALDRPSTYDGDVSESYTIPENQFRAWQWGAEDSRLEMAIQYLHDGWFESLAQGRNVLAQRHANSHVYALCSAAKSYLVLGDRKYLDAAKNGFEFILQQSFATGGFGPREAFLPIPARTDFDPLIQRDVTLPAVPTVGDSIATEHDHFETGCTSYNYFKLTRYLLRITKDSRYGDAMERLMYNGSLGALPLTQNGATFYYSDYHRGAQKRYFQARGLDCWACCSGSLPQLAIDYSISAYFHDKMGIFVNLYLPSTVRWREEGANVSLTQAGGYPLSDSMTFTVATGLAKEFTVRFRIPAWASRPLITINGAAVTARIKSGSFAAIRRLWHSGDRIEVTFPKTLELISADAQHPNLKALNCGPMVLFAIGEDLPRFDREGLLAARQVSAGEPVWQSGASAFLPWWVIRDEIYTTYHQVSAIRGRFKRSGTRTFSPPSSGAENDWVLVLDDATKGFPVPGGKSYL